MWSGFGWLRRGLIGNFCESCGDVLRYIKAWNLLAVGGIISGRFFTRYAWQGRRSAYSECIFVSWFGYKCTALWIVLKCACTRWYSANIACGRIGVVEKSSLLYEFAWLYLIYFRFIWSKIKTLLTLISLYEHILEYRCYKRHKWSLSERILSGGYFCSCIMYGNYSHILNTHIIWLYIINLMNWLLFIHKILFSSTCFEPQMLIFRRIQLYKCSVWYCHFLWEFLVACPYTAWVTTDCRRKVVGGCLKTPYQQPSAYSQFSLKLCTDRPPGTLIESDSTICCIYTNVSSWRWALEARNI